MKPSHLEINLDISLYVTNTSNRIINLICLNLGFDINDRILIVHSRNFKHIM